MDLNAHARVSLWVSLRDVPRLDYLSESDPLVAISLQDEHGTFKEIGRTEAIQNNPNPDFKTVVTLDYFFEERQTLRFHAVDVDSSSKDMSAHDLIGTLDVTLGDIITAPNGCFQVQLPNPAFKRFASIIIRSEEVLQNRDLAHMDISVDLSQSGFLRSPRVYFELLRIREDGSWVPVYTSQTMDRSTVPKFDTLAVKTEQLCNGDLTRPLQLRVFKKSTFGGDSKLGVVEFSLKEMCKAATALELKDGSFSVKVSGRVEHIASFLDYIKAGTEISLMVAVDFTGSNGDPSTPGSLHYLGRETPYEQAIRSVGSVLEPYDSDNKYPVWGFGAKLKETNQVSHCFPLTLSEDKVEVESIHGIMETYRAAFPHILLSGPTLFSEVIQMASALPSNHFSPSSQQYSILLILTDGIINDMRNTIQGIVDASTLPLSIIIVGVGNADFTAMNVLDADDTPLKHSDGRTAARDIVQFVPLNKFKSSMARLAREVLEEVPDQFISYCNLRGASPLERDSQNIGNLDLPPVYTME